MRLALLLLCALAMLAYAEECTTCEAFKDKPHAKILLSVQEHAGEAGDRTILNMYAYYENFSAADPRQPVKDSILIIEATSPLGLKRLYKTYTNSNGSAKYDFTEHTGGGCINLKVLYCPFCKPGAEQCAFDECLKFSKISNDCGYYPNLPACGTLNSTEPIPEAVGGNPLPALSDEKYFPDMMQLSYCAPPPPMSQTPALCLPLLIVFSLLGGSLYLTGRNPFMGFNVGSAHVGRHIRYQARGRGFSMSVQAIAGAVGTVKGAAKTIAQGRKEGGKGGGLKALAKSEKEAASMRGPVSGIVRGVKGIGGVVGGIKAGIAASKEAKKVGKETGKKAEAFAGIKAFTAHLNAVGAAARGGTASAKQVDTGKGTLTLGGGGSGMRLADLKVPMGGWNSGKGFFANVGGYYAAVFRTVLRAAAWTMLSSNFGIFMASIPGLDKLYEKMAAKVTDNEARMKEDGMALKSLAARIADGATVKINGVPATIHTEETRDAKGNVVGTKITFEAKESGKFLETTGGGKVDVRAVPDKLGITKITIELDRDGKVVAATASVVAAKDFGAFTKGEPLGTITFKKDPTAPEGGTTKFELNAAAMRTGEPELKKIDLRDFPSDVVSIRGSFAKEYLDPIAKTNESFTMSAQARLKEIDRDLKGEIKSPEVKAKLEEQREKAMFEAGAVAGLNLGTVEGTKGQSYARTMAEGIFKGLDGTDLHSTKAIAGTITKEVFDTKFAELEKKLDFRLSPETREAVATEIAKMLSTPRSTILTGKPEDPATNVPSGTMSMKEMRDYLEHNPGLLVQAVHAGLRSGIAGGVDEKKMTAIMEHMDENQLAGAVGAFRDNMDELSSKLKKNGILTEMAKQVLETGMDRVSNLYNTARAVKESYDNPAAILAKDPANLEMGGKAGDLLRERALLGSALGASGGLAASLESGAVNRVPDSVEVVNKKYADYDVAARFTDMHDSREWKKDIAPNNPGMEEQVVSAFSHSAKAAYYGQEATGGPSPPSSEQKDAFAIEHEAMKDDIIAKVKAGNYEDAYSAAKQYAAKADSEHKAEVLVPAGFQKTATKEVELPPNPSAAKEFDNLAADIQKMGQFAASVPPGTAIDLVDGVKSPSQILIDRINTMPDAETLAQRGNTIQRDVEVFAAFSNALSTNDPSKADLRGAERIAGDQVLFYRSHGDEDSAQQWEVILDTVTKTRHNTELRLDTEAGKTAYQVKCQELRDNAASTMNEETSRANASRIPDLEMGAAKALEMATEAATELKKSAKKSPPIQDIRPGQGPSPPGEPPTA